MRSLHIAVFVVCLAAIWPQSRAKVTIRPAKGNGILSCRPGVNFPRDCGNRCDCAQDGLSATCSNSPCPTTNKEFDDANRKVFVELDVIKGEGSGPVFRCEPYTERKVNSGNGSCYCAKSGKAEICSNRRGDPWGLKP